MASINFDKNKYESLKMEYQKSVDNQVDIFVFEGQEILTAYAKYLLEYLSPIFEKK